MLFSAVIALFSIFSLHTVATATCTGGNVNADLLVGYIVNSNQYIIANNLSFINGPNAPYTSALCLQAGSGPAFTALGSGSAAGGVDILSLTVDNMINRQLNNAGTYSLLATMDNQVGNVIVSTNGKTTFASLKGANIGVDSTTSGYVYEFQSIAQANGLLTTDYNLVAIGGTSVRYAAILAGSATVSGVVTEIDATILINPFTVEYPGAVSNSPITLLANVNDYLDPLAGTGVVALAAGNAPSIYNLPRKYNATIEFLKGAILGNAVLVNPANAALVQSILAYSNGLTSAQAAALYLQLLTPSDGINSVAPNLQFATTNLLNTAYLRQRFNGFTVTPQQNLQQLLTNGSGQFIDYTILNQAYAQAVAIMTIHVNVPASVATACVYNNYGIAPFIIYQAAATINQYVTGGCSKAPVVTFTSCSSTDATFSPSECTYNPNSDSVSIIPTSGVVYGSRVVTVTYTASDICGMNQQINQTVTIQPFNFKASSCILIL